jgi:hypothetical protein
MYEKKALRIGKLGAKEDEQAIETQYVRKYVAPPVRYQDQ